MPQGIYPRPSPEERFWAKVDKGDGTGCWLWTAHALKGYGYFRLNGKHCRAHRVAYELMVGPIPDGLTIDHVKANGCTSTLCVKAIADEFGPAHLEPVTMRENLLRGDTLQARNARKTHCPQGHPFDEANTMRYGGSRHCRACHKAQAARYDELRRAGKRPARKRR